MDPFDDAATQPPPSPPTPAAPAASAPRTRPAKPLQVCADGDEASPNPVTLTKGRHHWSFSCEPGEESELLRSLSDLARRKDAPFDWFDAALVSHQLSKRLKSGLQRIDGGDMGTSP